MSEGEPVHRERSTSADDVCDRLRTACALAFVGSYFLPVGRRVGDSVLLGYQAASGLFSRELWGELGPFALVPGLPCLSMVALAFPHVWTRWFCAVLSFALLGMVAVLIGLPWEARPLTGFWVWTGSMGGIALLALRAAFRPVAERARWWSFRFVATDLLVFAGCFASCVYWAYR